MTDCADGGRDVARICDVRGDSTGWSAVHRAGQRFWVNLARAVASWNHPVRPERAATAIERVDQVWISTISLWEVATLVRLGRVALDRPQHRWVEDLLAGSVGCLDVGPAVAVEAGSLEEFHGDPADRIIYATAQEHRMALVTEDRRLSDHAASQGMPVIW